VSGNNPLNSQLPRLHIPVPPLRISSVLTRKSCFTSFPYMRSPIRLSQWLGLLCWSRNWKALQSRLKQSPVHRRYNEPDFKSTNGEHFPLDTELEQEEMSIAGLAGPIFQPFPNLFPFDTQESRGFSLFSASEIICPLTQSPHFPKVFPEVCLLG